MKRVIPLRYGTAFKKALGDPQVFTNFVKAVLGIEIHTALCTASFTGVIRGLSIDEATVG